MKTIKRDLYLNRLIERRFITEMGRLDDAPGRPILFGTTKEFLQTFGIESISELPEFESLAVPEEDEILINTESEAV